MMLIQKFGYDVNTKIWIYYVNIKIQIYNINYKNLDILLITKIIKNI